MFSLIGQILKYTTLVLTVLILSHVIQIRGTSISRHVENSLNWVVGGGPIKQVTRVTQELSSGISNSIQERNQKVERIANDRDIADARNDISIDDKRQLNRIIQKSQKR